MKIEKQEKKYYDLVIELSEQDVDTLVRMYHEDLKGIGHELPAGIEIKGSAVINLNSNVYSFKIEKFVMLE